ncbi:MAG: hypothetical protein ABWX70_03135 [Hyphomicrobium sp.]
MAALIALEGTLFVRRVINRVGLNAAQHHQCAAFRTVWQLGLFHHRHRELIYAARPSRLSRLSETKGLEISPKRSHF